VLVALGWGGLRVKAPPFPAFAMQGGDLNYLPLPEGLPAPVERFYRLTFGERVPVVHSAVVTGRGTMTFGGISAPARFRFSYELGKGYRHYFEVTFFGLPVMRANEWFHDGHGRLELPFGKFEGPKVDQGGNLALWAESIWAPSIYLTDPRVTWQGIDDASAIMRVPFKDGRESFIVRFDPDSGRIRTFESMRYRDEKDTAKILWLNEVHQWGSLAGLTLPTSTSVTWFDQGKPWAWFNPEEVVYNADLSRYLLEEGL
jgi:hypothetical protein